MKLFDPDRALIWLFCLTHPDDELAIAGWIHRLAAAGVEVHLSWTTAAPERMYEAQQAAKLLRVPPERLHFHAGQDRNVVTQLSELLPSFAAMVERVGPDRVVAGAFEQGHLDHDSTNLLLFHALQGRSGILLETPFYHAYSQPIPTMNRFADPEGEEVLVLTPAEVELKKRLAHGYPSQNIWGNLIYYRLLQGLLGEREPIGLLERLRRQTHFDFRSPNLSPGLNMQVCRTSRWHRWIAALDAFESSPFGGAKP